MVLGVLTRKTKILIKGSNKRKVMVGALEKEKQET